MNTTSKALIVVGAVLILLGFFMSCEPSDPVPLGLISVDYTPVDAAEEPVDEDITFTVEAEGSDLDSLWLYIIDGTLEIGEEYTRLFTFYTSKKDPTITDPAGNSQKAELSSAGLSVTYVKSKKTWEITFEKGKKYYNDYFAGKEVIFDFIVKNRDETEESEIIEWIFRFQQNS